MSKSGRGGDLSGKREARNALTSVSWEEEEEEDESSEECPSGRVEP